MQKEKNNRALSLDALRGYAILTMVLSAMVAGGILPAWMYHAQTPPPSHAFQPELSGLTWVDLVFPFFLFAMGAAFPFSLRRKAEAANRDLRFWAHALGQVVARAALLTFFAIFLMHAYPYMQSDNAGAAEQIIAIGCFALLFAMYLRFPKRWDLHPALKWTVRIVGFAVAIAVLYTDSIGGQGIDLHISNIIILLLANMAFFGSLAYYATMRSHWARMWLLVALAGLFLSADIEGSWTQRLASYSPIDWFYRFAYLKYLFIVLAGSVAGDMLYDERHSSEPSQNKGKPIPAILAFCSLLAIIFTLTGLFCRWSLVTLVVDATLAILIWVIARLVKDHEGQLWTQLAVFGGTLLVVGLCFEPFEGGIKKDGPTFCYLLVTAGLACYALVFFSVICDYYGHKKATKWLWANGQNPMIAYVAADLLVLPVLSLLGLTKYFYIFHANAWMGLLQGILLTSAAMLVTMLFTNARLFWRS